MYLVTRFLPAPQLAEREEDLAAARAANRELMARLNTPTRLR